MSNNYHKIQTVFKRDLKGRDRKIILGDFSTPEFEYLKNNLWDFSEKFDGMCLNTCYNPMVPGGIRNPMFFQGKTDRSIIPEPLLTNLQNHFLPRVGKLKETFEDMKVELLLEGYGEKIQKGGGNYLQGDQSFILFDVKINDHWQERSDVEDIAKKMDIKVVPIVGRGTLLELVDYIKKGFISTFGDFYAEGIVARPLVEMNNRIGQRIITKLKHLDFQR